MQHNMERFLFRRPRLMMTEAVVRRCSVKKVFLEISQNSQENTRARRISFLIKFLKIRLFFKNKTLARVFSCEFCEISKNTFYYRTPLVAASVMIKHAFRLITGFSYLFYALCP